MASKARVGAIASRGALGYGEAVGRNHARGDVTHPGHPNNVIGDAVNALTGAVGSVAVPVGQAIGNAISAVIPKPSAPTSNVKGGPFPGGGNAIQHALSGVNKPKP